MAVPDPTLLRVCPFLGLPDDPGSHYSFPELGHRCHAKTKVIPLDLGYQATFCLGGGYQDCARFQKATRPVPAWHPAADSPDLVHTVHSAPAAHPSAPASPRRRNLRRTLAGRVLSSLAGLLMIVLLVAGVWIVANLTNPGRGGGLNEAGSASPTPFTAAQSPLPAAVATAAPAEPSFAPTAEPGVQTSPPPNPTLSPSAEPTPLIRVVREGESLSLIAAEYGLTWIDIARANELQNPDTLYVGQRLLIPTGPVPTGPLPTAVTAVHVVGSGETLAGIAARYGVSERRIAQANDIEDPDLIYVGQRLVIPPPTP